MNSAQVLKLLKHRTHTMCSDVLLFIRSKYTNNQFSSPPSLTSKQALKQQQHLIKIQDFCSSTASIRNNCNVFTCGRLTDLSCNVAVLNYILVVCINLLRRLAGNMKGRYFQSSFYKTASLTILHTVHPYHGH